MVSLDYRLNGFYVFVSRGRIEETGMGDRGGYVGLYKDYDRALVLDESLQKDNVLAQANT